VLLEGYFDISIYDMKAVVLFTSMVNGALRSGLAPAGRPRYITAEFP